MQFRLASSQNPLAVVQIGLAPLHWALHGCKMASHRCKRHLHQCKTACIIARPFCSSVSYPRNDAGHDCTVIPSALLVAMEFGCLVKLGRHTTPLPIPNREVKPFIADDTALVCGKVGSRQSLTKGNPIGFPFLFYIMYNEYRTFLHRKRTR